MQFLLVAVVYGALIHIFGLTFGSMLLAFYLVLVCILFGVSYLLARREATFMRALTVKNLAFFFGIPFYVVLTVITLLVTGGSENLSVKSLFDDDNISLLLIDLIITVAVSFALQTIFFWREFVSTLGKSLLATLMDFAVACVLMVCMVLVALVLPENVTRGAVNWVATQVSKEKAYWMPNEWSQYVKDRWGKASQTVNRLPDGSINPMEYRGQEGPYEGMTPEEKAAEISRRARSYEERNKQEQLDKIREAQGGKKAQSHNTL